MAIPGRDSPERLGFTDLGLDAIFVNIILPFRELVVDCAWRWRAFVSCGFLIKLPIQAYSFGLSREA
jgi:hypothetical protein